MVLRSLSRGHGGVVFGCSSNRNHTRSPRVHSVFEKNNLLIQDIMLFIKSYLERNSLANMYNVYGFLDSHTPRLQSTGPLSYARYLKSIFTPTLRGLVEIDESLFSRRVKNHRGNPNRGTKVMHFYIFIIYSPPFPQANARQINSNIFIDNIFVLSLNF